MKQTPENNNGEKRSGGFEVLPDNEFYTASPTQQPLHEDRRVADLHQNRNSRRHQQPPGRREPRFDQREMGAVLGILRSIIIIILLLIALFMLAQGVRLYEKRVFLDHQTEQMSSPVMQELVLADELDVEKHDTQTFLAERTQVWDEANRLVRSAEGLISKNSYNLAIQHCQDALRQNPTHLAALEMLGEMYLEKGENIKAINTYVRLIGVDPSRTELQEMLIKALDANNDAAAVVYAARWYLERNLYDEDVQHYLAHAFFVKEDFPEAITAYERVLKDSPNDATAMWNKTTAHMALEEYDEAIIMLNQLHKSRFQNPDFYQRLAVCYAQLEKSDEAIQALGKAAHKFGQDMVVQWIISPQFDPIREDRSFQVFSSSIGSEEFRQWMERMASATEASPSGEILPQLNMPTVDKERAELLQKQE